MTGHSGSDAPSTPLTRIVLGFVILVTAALSASTWRVYGHTWDEPEHLAAGIELLDRGRYEYDTEHPPIGRILMALGPYLAGARSYGTPPPDGVQEGLDILYRSGHYDEFLTLARLGMMPFYVLLLLAMWLWARRVACDDTEALLGVVLLATVPPILGHAALAALDVAAAATSLLALYALQSWIVSARWRDAAFFGAATGLAFATKFSAIPFVALGMIVLGSARIISVTADRRAFPWRAKLGGLALAIAVAAIPVVMAYGIHSADPRLATRRFNWAVGYWLDGHPQAIASITSLSSHIWLPRAFKLFAEGVTALKAHNDTGHISFLLGRLKANGWWYFYLVGLTAKSPITLLLSSPIGLALMARDGWRERNLWRLAPLLLFVTLLVFASTFSHINIGIRHVFILYPFLALGGAYALAKAWRALATLTNRQAFVAGRAAILVLVGWQVSSLWTAYPDYLPYFNEGVADPRHVLVDSDLDWGQDLRRLEGRLTDLKVHNLSLAYLGTADLEREHLPSFTRLAPYQPTTGWIAITALTRVHWPQGYSWINAYKPIERIGKTIDLYYITPPRGDARCAPAPADANSKTPSTPGPASASSHCPGTV